MVGKRGKDSLPRAGLPCNFRWMLATDMDRATASAAAAGGAEKRAYVQRIFSEIAPRYDLLNHVPSLNIDRRWRRKAIARLGVDRDQAGRYLDLCTGTMDVAGAIVAFGIRNVAGLDESLQEAFRVLVPGGRFVILEFSTPRIRLLRVLY